MITVTTINDSAATAKTFTLTGVGVGEQTWYNSTDESNTYSVTLSTKSVLSGKTKYGQPIRRVTVTCKAVKIDSTEPAEEIISTQFSCFVPNKYALLSAPQVKDCRAFLLNFLSEANFMKLLSGEA